MVLGQEHLVCRLHQALYGLKQASRSWYINIDTFLKTHGLNSCFVDPNIYFKRVHPSLVIIASYVDDTFFFGNDLPLLFSPKKPLSSAFEMVDLGEIHSC